MQPVVNLLEQSRAEEIWADRGLQAGPKVQQQVTAADDRKSECKTAPGWRAAPAARAAKSSTSKSKLNGGAGGELRIVRDGQEADGRHRGRQATPGNPEPAPRASRSAQTARDRPAHHCQHQAQERVRDLEKGAEMAADPVGPDPFVPIRSVSLVVDEMLRSAAAQHLRRVPGAVPLHHHVLGIHDRHLLVQCRHERCRDQARS